MTTLDSNGHTPGSGAPSMENMSDNYGSDNLITNHGDVDSFLNGTSNPTVEPMSGFGNSQDSFVGGPLPFESQAGQSFTNVGNGISAAMPQSVPKKAPPPRKKSDAPLQYNPGYENGKMKKVESGKDPLSQKSNKK